MRMLELAFIWYCKATKIQTLIQYYVEKCSTPFTFLKLIQCNYLQMNRVKNKYIQVKYLLSLGIFDFNFRQDKLSVQVWALLKKKVAGFARGQNYVYQVLKKLKWYTMEITLLNWCNLVSISKKLRCYMFGFVRIY